MVLSAVNLTATFGLEMGFLQVSGPFLGISAKLIIENSFVLTCYF